MEAYFSKEVMDGLRRADAVAERKKSRLRVHAGNEVFPVQRSWADGFAVDRSVVPDLRGLVDLYDGARHLSQCLIIGSEAEGDVMTYEFKRKTPHADSAPLDYERPDDAPVALLR